MSIFPTGGPTAVCLVRAGHQDLGDDGVHGGAKGVGAAGAGAGAPMALVGGELAVAAAANHVTDAALGKKKKSFLGRMREQLD